MARENYDSLDKMVAASKEAFKKRASRAVMEYGRILADLGRGKPTFYIRIISYWSGQGERDIEYSGSGDLKRVLARANGKFNRANKRYDSQRRAEVFIVSGNLKIPVPQKFYKKK